MLRVANSMTSTGFPWVQQSRCPPCFDQVSSGCCGIIHFEGYANLGTGLAIGLYLVDQPHLGGVGNLQGSPAGFEDSDARIPPSPSKAACSVRPRASRKNANAAS